MDCDVLTPADDNVPRVGNPTNLSAETVAPQAAPSTSAPQQSYGDYMQQGAPKQMQQAQQPAQNQPRPAYQQPQQSAPAPSFYNKSPGAAAGSASITKISGLSPYTNK
jgi:hypothetical protein